MHIDDCQLVTQNVRGGAAGWHTIELWMCRNLVLAHCRRKV